MEGLQMGCNEIAVLRQMSLTEDNGSMLLAGGNVVMYVGLVMVYVSLGSMYIYVLMSHKQSL